MREIERDDLFEIFHIDEHLMLVASTNLIVKLINLTLCVIDSNNKIYDISNLYLIWFLFQNINNIINYGISNLFN